MSEKIVEEDFKEILREEIIEEFSAF